MNSTANEFRTARRKAASSLPATLALGLLASLGACDCAGPGADAGPADSGAVDCPEGTPDCACAADDVCEADLACQGGTCRECAWGTRGCPCDDGACDGDMLCDATDRECRAPTSCELAGCAQYQLCEEPDAGDAVCLAECSAGYTWNETTSACAPTPSCDPNAPGLLTCPTGIGCRDDGAGVRCEGCAEDYTDLGNGCLPNNSCATWCGAGRDCTFPNDGQFLGDNGPALCGDCQSGFAYDGDDDICVPRVTCDQLTCGTQTCVPATAFADAFCRPPATCGDGQVETAAGNCATCVHCYDDADGQVPLPGVAGVGNDGYASGAVCVCELEDGWFQSIDGALKPCDADGDGWLNADIEPVLQRNGGENPFAAEQRCTVRTVGQFELAADVGDATSQAPSTRAVTVNDLAARWALPQSSYTVDAAGRAYVRLIEPEVLDVPALFEDRYDPNNVVPTLRLKSYGGFDDAPPEVGDGGVVDDVLNQLRAAQVNPLTKACNHDNDDLNLDSVPDVSQTHDLPPDVLSNLLDNAPVFYRMSYFLELHRSFWRDRTAECAAQSPIETPCHGAYVIKEKARALGPAHPDGLELRYEDRSENGLTADYWTKCARGRDATYMVGFEAHNVDFAAWHEGCLGQSGRCEVQTDVDGDGEGDTIPHVPYDGRAVRPAAAVSSRPVDNNAAGTALWPGMNHHSQFKCVSGKSALPADERGREAPADYDLNLCRVVAGTDPVAAGALVPNPSDPVLECEVTPGAPRVADDSFNRWAAVVSSPDTTLAYEAGCITEGAEWGHLCLLDGGAVNNHPAMWGALFCECGPTHSGASCEIGCPAQQALSDSFGGGSAVIIADGELFFSRKWMCAAPYVAHEESVGTGSDDTPYRLLTDLPAAASPSSPMSGTAAGGVTYTLSAPPRL